MTIFKPAPLSLLALIIIASSCTTQRRCTQKFPCQTGRDSIYIETLREVPIYIAGDSVTIEVPTNCPDAFYEAENGQLKNTIKILNNRLISVAKLKPRIDTVTVVDTRTEVVYRPQVVEKFRTPRFMKWLAFIGLAALAYIIAGLYFEYKK